jgi:PAS domain S-box-containing protein
MMRNQTTRLWRSAAQCFFGSIALALITLVFFRLELGLATTASAYLIVIVLLSLMGSFSVSVVLSFMAVAGLNYFFAPPIFEFRVDLPQDIVLLIAFVLTSLTVTGLVGLARKQTETALQAEARAKQAERELRLGIDTIPALVWSTQPDGSLDFINQRWQEIGLSLDDLRGSEWAAVIHPHERAAVVDKWRTAVEAGTPYENIERVRRADGEYRWFLSRAAPLRDELGKIVKWYGADTDIEDRMRAEAALRRSEAYLAEAQRLSRTGSFGWNVSSGEIFWSDESFRIFGYDKALSATVDMVLRRVHPEELALVQRTIDRASRDGKDFDLEHRLLMPDGSVRTVHLVAHAVRDEAGQLEFNGALMDVTASKRAEEELHKAQADLAHVTRVTTLGELTTSIAHEVNQPLAAVAANAEACLRWLDRGTPDLDEARRTVEWIIKDSNRAGEVIRRVRALSSRTETQKAPLDVNGVVNEVIALLRRELFSHRVSLRMELAPALPVVQADRVQLQQVIINLLMNGMEAMAPVTDRPREMVIQSHQDEAHQVLVSVKDCGIGISADNADQLFNAFFTTKPSGMGMGLSICRSIIEAHGGRLSASGNVGPGATFQFALPTYRQAAS